MSQKPSVFPDWATSAGANISQPPASQLSVGHVAGQPLIAAQENFQKNLVGQWVRYFSGAIAANTTLSTIDPNIRLIGGGLWTWNNSTSTLSWSETVYIAYPGLTDAQNALAAGSVTLPSGSVAYLTTNNPVVMPADVTSGSTSLTNVARPDDLQTGWQVSGPGIPSGATVKSIDVAGQTVTLSASATSTNAQAAISFARVGALSAQVAAMSSYSPTASGVIFARATDNSCIVGVGTGQMHLGDSEQRRFLRQGFGATYNVTAGVNLSQGQAVYISQGNDGRTAGSAYPCDASAANGATRAKCAGFVYQAASAGSTARVVASGCLPLSVALSPGATYYLDPATPGAITSTRPSQLLQYVVPVGQAISASTLLLPNAFQASPRTLDAMCDHVVVPIGAMRFENGYKAGGNQACIKIIPSGTGPINGFFYQTFDRSPFLTKVDAMADSNSATGIMTFSLQYQYDGSYISNGPYGAPSNGIAMSSTLARHGFASFSAAYTADTRSQNFVFDGQTAYLGIANLSANMTTNMAVDFALTLAYPPA